MENKVDQRFFALCEYILSDIEHFENVYLSKKEKILNRITNSAGVIGIIIAYTMMVLKKGTINLTLFRDIAILDIKGNLILGKQEIASEQTELPLRRCHFPSLRIIQEICKAYLKYSSEIRTSPPCHPVSNKLYLFWLLNFFFYRSVVFANSKKILLNLKSVVTYNEYMPSICGCLSAFYDLSLPLSLYIGIKNNYPDLTIKSLCFFSQVIASNGSDADTIRSHCEVPLFIERRNNKPIFFDSIIAPRIGVFLSSYYTTESQILKYLINNKVLSFLENVQKDWNAQSVVVHCHPNDMRPKSLLNENNIFVYESNSMNGIRMRNYDIIFCGNTSVVEEALNEGIPVVYTGDLDTYTYDLYGYVNSGIVCDATYSIPSRADVQLFYDDQDTQDRIYNFKKGINDMEAIDFIEAICRPL